MKSSKGFTLIEMATTIIIISVIIGMVIIFANSWTSGINKNSDNLRINNIISLLQNYYSARGSLPCPARPDIASTNSGNGVASTDCFSTCPTGLTCTASIAAGAIPFVTLNIPEQLTKDQMGNRYSYTVDRKFTVNNQTSSNCFANVAYKMCYGGGRIVIQDANSNPITSQAIAVLVAYGDNENGAYSADSGVQNACVTAKSDGSNCNGDNIFIIKPDTKSQTANTVFDDQVSYTLNPQQQNCPNGVIGCNLWLDSADICSLDCSATNTISAWYDKSVSNIQFTQVTASSQPTFQALNASFINGRPYLSFNNQFLSAISTSFAGTGTTPGYDFTHTVVFQTLDASAAITAVASAATLTATPYRLIGAYPTGGTASYFLYPSTTLTGITAINDNKTHIMTVTFSTTTGLTIYVDGQLVITNASATSTSLPTPNYMVIGGNSLWSNYIGNIMEIVNFPRILSSSERINMEKSLASKWAINY